ncbi:MAG: Rab family GTPase [Candidatus Hodarchaeota archaeon]
MAEVNRTQDFLYKLCFCGDGGVGKTSIINRYIGQGFQTNYRVTIGCQIVTHNLTIDGQILKFQFWDLSGQHRFEFIRSTFYRGSHAAILVFDLTRPLSLYNLHKWKEEILSNVGYEIPFIIFGNKSDLIDKIRVKEHEILEVTSELKPQTQSSEIPHFFTSAQSGLNLKEALTSIGQILRKSNPHPVYQNIFKKQRAGNAS